MKYLSLLFISSTLFAFTPPSDITSLLPENNELEIAPRVSTVPNVDQYTVFGTVVSMDKFGNCASQLSPDLSLISCIYSVSKGTPEKKVHELATANQAWAKLKAESLTPAEQQQAGPLQQAQLWFMRNIYMPYYWGK